MPCLLGDRGRFCCPRWELSSDKCFSKLLRTLCLVIFLGVFRSWHASVQRQTPPQPFPQRVLFPVTVHWPPAWGPLPWTGSHLVSTKMGISQLATSISYSALPAPCHQPPHLSPRCCFSAPVSPEPSQSLLSLSLSVSLKLENLKIRWKAQAHHTMNRPATLQRGAVGIPLMGEQPWSSLNFTCNPRKITCKTGLQIRALPVTARNDFWLCRPPFLHLQQKENNHGLTEAL